MVKFDENGEIATMPKMGEYVKVWVIGRDLIIRRMFLSFDPKFGKCFSLINRNGKPGMQSHNSDSINDSAYKTKKHAQPKLAAIITYKKRYARRNYLHEMKKYNHLAKTQL